MAMHKMLITRCDAPGTEGAGYGVLDTKWLAGGRNYYTTFLSHNVYYGNKVIAKINI